MALRWAGHRLVTSVRLYRAHSTSIRRLQTTSVGTSNEGSTENAPKVLDNVLPDVNNPLEHPLSDLGQEEMSTEEKFWRHRATQMVAPVYERVVDEQGRAQAIGKRKRSVAKVWISRGYGSVSVNDKNFVDYFTREALRSEIIRPLVLVGKVGHMDVVGRVAGGGVKGQAEAMRHGIARALLRWDPSLRSILKKDGLLTRDSRVVESKKYGKKKARKSFQWVKR